MDQKRTLAWVGAGGTALAATGVLVAGVFSLAPTDRSPVSDLSPCFSSGCTNVATVPTTAAARPAGRVTAPKPKAPAAPKAAVEQAPTTVALTAEPKATQLTSPLTAQHLSAPIVGMAASRDGSLVLVGADGGAFPVGEAGFFGSLSGKQLGGRVAAVATDPTTGGYWMAGSDGGVFSFRAGYFGSVSGARLSAPIAAMAAAPSGRGYWLVGTDGGVYAFGNARYAGSLSKYHLGAPVVAMAGTPSGRGYWLVSADGGVYAFGDARYAGSLSGDHLSAPVVAMAATPSGRGYWLVSSDGGVFAFGDAHVFGNATGRHQGAISAIVPTSDGHGYWLASQTGSVTAYGNATPVINAVAAAAHAAPTPAAPTHAVAAPSHVVAEARPKAAPVTSHGPVQPAKKPVTPHIDAHVNSHVTWYPQGASGIDISQYQCRDIPGTPSGVAVVQVTGGAIDVAPNPCYVQEARWAGAHMSAYIYMDGYPTTGGGLAAMTGPGGRCSATNVACQSLNYGYNWARYWVAYSRSLGVNPSLWWMDVENYSGWQDTISNQLVIKGALTGLSSMHVAHGIYSSTHQWADITGGMAIPGEAEWTPGAGNLGGAGYTAANFCGAPKTHEFGGGRLQLVQYGYSGPFPGSYSGSPTYDLDYACN
jgi:hypothetical protein